MSLNDDQKDYVRYLASLPADQLCACGWYAKREVERGIGGCGRAECPSRRVPREHKSNGD